MGWSTMRSAADSTGWRGRWLRWSLDLLVEAAFGIVAALAIYASILASESGDLTRVQFRRAVLASMLSGILAFFAARAGGYALSRRRTAHRGQAGAEVGERGGDGEAAVGRDLERFPTGARVWSLPGRNPNFTGREELLTRLHHLLDGGPTGEHLRAVVLCGLGGVGKTQLATEYCHRYGEQYDLVWWVPGEQTATIPARLATLAHKLGVPDAADQNDMVEGLWEALRQRDRWLLLFDNVERREDLEPFQPPAGAGHVLITSRSPSWGGMATTLAVNVMTDDEAQTFLRARTRAEDAATVTAIAQELGDLPLALEQAAAYMEETRTSPGGYLELLRRQPAKILARGSPTHTKQRVSTAWSISIERISSTPGAHELLMLCAFLAPDDIPRSLLTGHADVLPAPLDDTMRDGVAANDAVAALVRYSLVDASPTTGALSLHRLVQSVVCDSLDPAEQARWAGAAVCLLAASFSPTADDRSAWPTSQQLLPHVLTAAGHAQRLRVEPDATTWMLNCAAAYLRERGQLADAKAALEQVLAIEAAAYGPRHPTVAFDRNNLANVLQALGDLRGARTHLEEALDILEQARGYGPDHPAVATISNTLGRTLQNLGKWPEARDQLERALVITLRNYPEDHPKVVALRNTLGGVLQDLGHLDESQAQLEAALAVTEADPGKGPGHPAAAAIRGNLGRVLQERRDLGGAMEQLRRALAIDEAFYTGQRLHPALAVDHNNLGYLLHELGDLDGARAELEQAIAIYEAALGPNHQALATTRNNLGAVLHGKGELEGACRQYERASAIMEAAYGPEHPAVAVIQTNLGRVLRDLGDLDGARAAFRRALTVNQAAYDPGHPLVAWSQAALRDLPGGVRR